jgi:hypothetical protein
MLLTGVRYYWMAAKGYRLRPWKSPYIRWRMETYFGKEAEEVDARRFFQLCWRERARLWRFLRWVEELERVQKRGF